MKLRRPLIWIGLCTGLIFVAFFLLQRESARRELLRQKNESLSRELAEWRQKIAALRDQKEILDDERQRASEAVANPPLPPVEQTRRDLVAKPAELSQANRANRAPRPFSPSGPNGEIFPELMDDPDYARSVAALHEPSIEMRYGPWLKQFTKPDERSRLATLLLDHALAEYDAIGSAIHSGLDPKADRDEILQLQKTIQERVREELKQQVGEARYADYLAYERTVTARESLGSVVRRLSYSAEPLTSTQIEHIVSLMPPPRFGPPKPILEGLSSAKAAFSSGQWEQIETFAREGGVLKN